MRNDAFLRIMSLGLAASALALAGCSDGGDGVGIGGGTTPDPVVTPPPAEDFMPAGQVANPEVVYAPAPYGISKGSVIANFQFIGYVNSQVESGGFQLVQLADFYNPTGTDVYPEGSLYGAGQAKPKALLIDISSVWCGPCNFEADEVLPVEYLKYKPLGGQFLLTLADGPTVGKPATGKHLFNWTQKYDVDYPATYDPSYKLGNLFESDAFPQNMIVDTRTMQIVEVIAGSPDAAFWTKFEAVLNAP